jgi:hypothetical protein
VDDVYIKNTDSSKSIFSITQYLLTVKGNGDYIDGLKVQELLGKVDLGDESVDGKEIWGIVKWSLFKKDTLRVYEDTSYQHDSVLSEHEEILKQLRNRFVIQDIIQKTYSSRDESIYVIMSDGKIKKVSEKKGSIDKVEETKLESIKLPDGEL